MKNYFFSVSSSTYDTFTAALYARLFKTVLLPHHAKLIIFSHYKININSMDCHLEVNH